MNNQKNLVSTVNATDKITGEFGRAPARESEKFVKPSFKMVSVPFQYKNALYDLELLEDYVDHKGFHKRSQSDILSSELLSEAFKDIAIEENEWVPVVKNKQRQKRDRNISFSSPPPNDQFVLNPTIGFSLHESNKRDSKRFNLKEVKKRKYRTHFPHSLEFDPSTCNYTFTDDDVEDLKQRKLEEFYDAKNKEELGSFFDSLETFKEEFDQNCLKTNEFLDMFPRDTYESSECSEWLNYIENIVILTFQISRSTSLLDVSVAILAYVKMHYHSSIVSKLKTILCEFFSEDSQIIEPQAFEFKDFINKWEVFKTNPIYTKISFLISAAMALSVCDIKKIEWSPFGMKLLHLEALKEQVNAVDFFDAVIKTFTWMADVGYQVIQTRSLEPLLCSDKRMKAYHLLLNDVLANASQAIDGNTDCHEFRTKLSDIISQTRELAAIKTGGSVPIWITNTYVKLVDIEQQLINKDRNTALRFAPIGFGLTGPTGVGKSSLSVLTMTTALQAMGESACKDRIMSKDMFDQYDSTYTSDIVGVYMDDIGNGKPEFTKVAPTDVIIKFFNNIAAPAVKAELSGKGRVFINFKVGVMTSNLLDYGARLYSNCPESILRRFYHVRVRVKPEYCVSGSTLLNTDHPYLREPGLDKDLWELDILQCVPYDTMSGQSYTFEPFFVECDGQPVWTQNLDLRTYLSIVVTLSKKHKLKQEGLLRDNKAISTLEFCNECCLPMRMCRCTIKPHSFEIAQVLILNPLLCSVKGYFKRWTNPYSTIYWICGFKPVSQMITSEIGNCMNTYLNGTVTPFILTILPDTIYRSRILNYLFNIYSLNAAKYDLVWHYKWTHRFLLFFLFYSIVYDRTYFFYFLFFLIYHSFAMLFYLRGRFKSYREVYLNRDDVLQPHVRKKAQVIVGSTIAVAVIVLGLRFYYENYWKHKGHSESTHMDSSPGWLGYVMDKFGVKAGLSHYYKPTSTNQLTETFMKNNLLWAIFERPDGTGTRCNVVFLEKGIALCPEHVWYPDADMSGNRASSLLVTVHRSNLPGGIFTFRVDDTCCVFSHSLDLCVMFVPNSPDFRDKTQYLPVEVGSGKVVAHFIVAQLESQDKPLNFKSETVCVKTGQVGHIHRDFYGGSYTTSLAKVGSCMGILVADTKKSYILGFHIGGTNWSNKGVCMTVTLSQYLELKRQLKSKSSVLLSSKSTSLPISQYGKPLVVSGDIHPHSMASKLDNSACVELFGATRLRTTQKSRVAKSMLSSSVEKHLDSRNEWGPPQLLPNWKAYNATLEHIINPPLPFEPSLLERARQDWICPLLSKMKVYALDSDNIARPLTFRESIMGVNGKKFLDPLPMNTGMGFPVFGKKNKYFEDVFDHKGILIDRIPHESVLKEYHRMIETWKNGYRAYPVCSSTLKDEATNVASSKVRVFQAAPVALSLAIRKYYLPLVRFLSCYPLVSECAVGLNCFSTDWDKIMCHAYRFDSEEGVLGWDYSKYDVRMSSQVTKAVFRSLLDLAILANYSDEDIHIMEMMVNDVVHPLLDYNGVLLMAFNMNTSGNNITVNINSIAGSFYVRMGVFSLTDIQNFRDHVGCMTYGDDFIGSIQKQYHNSFNFVTYKQFLLEHNMKITLPDKSNGESLFLDVHNADFLKRKSNYIPEIDCTVGILDENSILKPLHVNLKSDSQTPKEVAISVIESQMHEWFGYGKEHYELRRSQMTQVCLECNIPIDVVSKTFEDRVAYWKAKYLLDA